MSFNGQILERGFWLYVWKIDYNRKQFFYVGRTGDSSSAHASSPFNRIGQHLDFRESAKGATLAKRLKEVGVNPRESQFNMLALGPFFNEQDTFEKHKPLRDYLATLEFEVAKHLKSKGFNVLGVHHLGSTTPQSELIEIKEKLDDFVL